MNVSDRRQARPLTREDLLAVSIGVAELSRILGVHRTTISDLLSQKTGSPTPGAHAIVWLWARLTEEQRKALRAGLQFVEAPAEGIRLDGA